MVDGNEHEATDPDNEGRRGKTPDDRAERADQLRLQARLGSRDSSASLTVAAVVSWCRCDPIDWDSFTGLVDDDVQREYKTDGDLPSIIVQLANQIASPDTLAQRALRMNALAKQTDHADAANAEHAPVPSTQPADIPVATVDDDPMLSAVVGQILEAPIESPVDLPAPRRQRRHQPRHLLLWQRRPRRPHAPATPAPSALAPAVSAPVEPVPEARSNCPASWR